MAPCNLCRIKGGTNINEDGGCRHSPRKEVLSFGLLYKADKAKQADEAMRVKYPLAFILDLLPRLTSLQLLILSDRIDNAKNKLR